MSSESPKPNAPPPPDGPPAGDSGGSAPPPAAKARTPLRIGGRLRENLYDSRGTLLARAGTLVTPRLMDLLKGWRLSSKKPRSIILPDSAARDDGSVMAIRFSTRLSDMLDQATMRGIGLAVEPGGPRLPYHEVSSLGAGTMDAVASRQAQQVEAAGNLQELARSVLTGGAVDIETPGAVVGDLIERIWADPDLLLALTPLREADNEYLFLHAVNVCTLSILMAQHLGYDREQVTTLGLAALLHDLGMLRVPGEIRNAARPLKSDEMYEVMKHPFYTVEILERLHRLPTAVPLIAYQVHERIDAGGYPRNRHPNMIHTFAKLIAVADVYNAMIERRPWREPKLTYPTMVELLNLTSHGRFDRDAVRTLVERVGLFPVGSVVVLNTGLQCLVRRANPSSYVKPIVEVIGPPGSPKLGQVVDLSEWPHLEIAGCMAAEEFAAEQGGEAAAGQP